MKGGQLWRVAAERLVAGQTKLVHLNRNLNGVLNRLFSPRSAEELNLAAKREVVLS
jgi:hypothetical protein